MTRRRTLWMLAAYLALVTCSVPLSAAAQGGATSTSPLKATLTFPPSTTNFTFQPLSSTTSTPPLTLVLLLTIDPDVTQGPIFTAQGFSTSDFWRNLYFTGPNGTLITNTAGATLAAHPPVFFCFSRSGVLQVPTAIPVLPVEILPSSFSLEYTIPDARTLYSLTQAGHYTVNARIPLRTFANSEDPNAVITDCDQFPGETLVNVGQGVPGQMAFTIVSNGLAFDIAGDSLPPTTTVSAYPTANTFGWNNTDVTLTFTATHDPDGSGVKQIIVTTTGGQSGHTVLSGASSTLTVHMEGTTNVIFYAVDNAGNAETPHSMLVKLDKTAPQVTCRASPTTLWPPNHQLMPVTASVTVTDALSGQAGFVLTSAKSNEPDSGLGSGDLPHDIQGFVAGKAATNGQLRAERAGSGTGRAYALVYTAKDVAGNTATCHATITVPHDQR